MGRSKRKRNGDRTTRALANMALQLKEQAFKRRFGELDDDKLLNYLAYCTEEWACLYGCFGGCCFERAIWRLGQAVVENWPEAYAILRA